MNALTRDLEGLTKSAEACADGKDRFRQKLHLMPPTGWLNDPNGLCQFKGIYHAFFQYSPFNATGGLKMWGHYTSRDMIEWKYEGVSLYPDQPFDCHGVYSGSAFIEDGKMYLYYTGNVKLEDGEFDYIRTGREANTVLVVSEDGERFGRKRELMRNSDYPQDLTCHVRDPKVWKENGMYYMVQGARTQKDEGKVLIFESEDRLNWIYKSDVKTAERFGYMWECPDYFETEGRKILSTSVQGLEGGVWDARNVYQSGYFLVEGDILSEYVLSDYELWDYGFDYYAPQSFESEDGRRIHISWMGMPDCEEYTNLTLEDGWQHCFTFPREVHVKDKKVLQQPVKELEALRRGEERAVSVLEKKGTKVFEAEVQNITGNHFRAVLAKELMTEMKEQYLEGATKEQISGYLRAAVGEPAMLTVWTEDISVTVYSEQTVQEAQNQPMEVSRIQKQLSKTGATEFVFEHLEIDLEGKVFLPMQQLNELRRQALEKLELEICGKFRRTSTEQPLLKQNSEEKKTEGVLLSVLTETLEQLESVLDSEAAERIYIDSNVVQDLFEDARLQHLCKKAKRSSAKIFLAMPHIFRADAVRKFEQHYDRFLEIAQDGVLIRNCESFQFLKQHGFDRTILLDHNLYVFNQYSRQFWKRNGVELFTAPMELNAEELNVLGLEESELVIYGRIPVMTSAQCVVKTTNGCTHHPVTITLTDRRGKQFPVKNHCGFCYNIVYNSAPLSLFDEREEWMRMHPRSIRVQFSTETGSEVTRILNAALAVNTRNAVSGMSGEEFTRGHFRRGIT